MDRDLSKIVGTLATAVTPLNPIVVAPIAYTERNKNASRKRDLWKPKRKTPEKESNGDKWKINIKTEKATRFSKGKNTKVKEEVMALAKSQRSLKAWTKQKWRTKSGKPSTQGPKATGERYSARVCRY